MIYRVISCCASINDGSLKWGPILSLNFEKIAPSAHYPSNYLAEINFALSDNSIIIGDIDGLYNDFLDLNETGYFLAYLLIQKPFIMLFLLVGYPVKMISTNQRVFEQINPSQQQDTSSGYLIKYTLRHPPKLGLVP